MRNGRWNGAARRVVMVVSGVALAVTAVVLPTYVLPAGAVDTTPVDTTPRTVSADVLPTVQVNGVVWDQLVVGDRVYATGQFTSARPAGAAAGTDETPRSNILAYDITTGELVTGFAPALNAQGFTLAASADGATIFVGGDFTAVSGTNRYRMAALDAATGAVLTTFTTSANARVGVLRVSGGTLYAAGSFSVAGGQPRSRLAAFSTANGALQPWAPAADATVTAMTVPEGTGSVVVGGRFTTLNGEANYGLGAVDAVTGGTRPFAANQVVRNAGADASINHLTSAGGVVYGSGYTFGGGGNFEGTFAADAATGALAWVTGCRGDTYGTAVVAGVHYNVGHAHDCSHLGSFPQTSPWTYQRAIAQTLTADRANIGGSFAGQPAPAMLHWLPTLATGSYTGQDQAAWSVAGNGEYVVLGGEFPSINGVAQQGLARFAMRDSAPNKAGPLGHATLAPTVTGIGPGTARLTWTASWDRDDERLTYEVLRGAQLSSATVIGTAVLDSSWFRRPTMGFTDTVSPPGSSQSYRIRVTDPLGNTLVGPTVVGTVPAGTPVASSYRNRVVADGALDHWRLGEATGTVHDHSGAGDLTPVDTAVRGVAGAIAGDADKAVTFPGSSAVPAATAGAAQTAPQTFSAEAWFRTTTTSGGKLVGFGSSPNGGSGAHDRHIYMANDGRLVFGVSNSAVRAVTSPTAYNDGQWHHVVGTFDTGGLKLYVDSALVGSLATVSAASYLGHWRVGGDAIGGSWPTRPTSTHFAGTLDEVATYPTALPAAAVLAHWQLGTGTVPNQAPAAAFTASSTDLTASVDASGSTDPDGMVAAYAWTFGDGGTATGATASRTYAAAGTYTVTLTVTDDDGATATATRSVTVTAPPAAGTVAADTFTRAVATGWGTADTGGAWTIAASGSTASVADGAGRISIPAGRTATLRLPSVSSTGTDLLTTTWTETMPTGGGVYLSAVARSTAAGDYRSRVRVQSTGQVSLNLSRLTGTTETALTTSGVVPGLTYTASTRLLVRTQVVGTGPTTLRAKVWAAGTAEPAAWLQTVTDSTGDLQEAGSVGLVTYVSGTATGPLAVRHDDLLATQP